MTHMTGQKGGPGWQPIVPTLDHFPEDYLLRVVWPQTPHNPVYRFCDVWGPLKVWTASVSFPPRFLCSSLPICCTSLLLGMFLTISSIFLFVYTVTYYIYITHTYIIYPPPRWITQGGLTPWVIIVQTPQVPHMWGPGRLKLCLIQNSELHLLLVYWQISIVCSVSSQGYWL